MTEETDDSVGAHPAPINPVEHETETRNFQQLLQAAKLRFVDLLITKPLYAAIDDDAELVRVLQDKVLSGKSPIQFDLYCDKCRQITPWKIASGPSDRSGGYSDERYSGVGAIPTVVATYAVCLRQQHYYVYMINTFKDGVRKVGQMPALADLAFAQLKTLPDMAPEDRRELDRAIGLFAHDAPLGAFVYLRRVFERMIDRAHEAYTISNGGQITNWHMLRMGERVTALGNALPREISANAAVFGLLSKGIHELSDTDAETLFPLIKAVILQMLGDEERHRQAALDRAETDRALQSALSKYGA